MRETFFKRFGQGPYPFPIEKVDQFLEIYDSNGLNICLSRTETFFTGNDGTHSHDTYEFLIPSDPMPYIILGDKYISLNANNILPINSWQIHGPFKEMRIKQLLCSHIDKKFLLDIAFQLFNVDEFLFRNEPLIPNNEIKQIMEQFIQEARIRQAGHQFILECLSTQLVVKLLRLERNCSYIEECSIKPSISNNIKKVIDFLEENYTSNDYSTKEIANLANLSRFHFIRAFKNETGKTPFEYLIDIKVERAKEMLKNKNYSITEICSLCGFTNHSHFSTTFKKRLGISPSEYRKTIVK